MGWWIAKSGKIYPNEDHFGFLKANPKLFGLTAKFAASLGLAEREAALTEVVKDGWIRVRGDRRNGLTFEIPTTSEEVLFRVKDFLLKTKWDPSEKVLVDEIGSGTSPLYERVSYFTSDEALAVARNPRKRRVKSRR